MPKQHLDVIDYFGPLAAWVVFFSVIFIISVTCILWCCVTEKDDTTVFAKLLQQWTSYRLPYCCAQSDMVLELMKSAKPTSEPRRVIVTIKLVDDIFEPVLYKSISATQSNHVDNQAAPVAAPDLFSCNSEFSGDPITGKKIFNARADLTTSSSASSTRSHCAGDSKFSSLIVPVQVKPAERPVFSTSATSQEPVQMNPTKLPFRSYPDQPVNLEYPADESSYDRPTSEGLPRKRCKESTKSSIVSSHCNCSLNRVGLVPPGSPWCTNKNASMRESYFLSTIKT